MDNPRAPIWLVTVVVLLALAPHAGCSDDGRSEPGNTFEPAGRSGDQGDHDSAHFVTIQDGGFRLGSRPWHPVGVNYWPHYAQKSYRDSRLDWVTMAFDKRWAAMVNASIEADLDLMQRRGINEIRVPSSWVYTRHWADRDPATYPSRQRSYCARLRHLLDRALAHGIRVTLVAPLTGKQWHASPNVFEVAASGAVARKYIDYTVRLIDRCELSGHRGLLGYTLDIEGAVEYCSGAYRDRNKHRNIGSEAAIALWNDWVVERHGSIAAAEARWGVSLPRECTASGKPACPPKDDGSCAARGPRLCPPPDAALVSKGAMAPATRAFRRFVAAVINKRFQRLTAIVRAHDPRHLITSDSGVDGWCNLCFPFITRATTKYLDFASPHVYHMAQPEFRANATWFPAKAGSLRRTAAALAYLDPGRRPVVIGEFGAEASRCDNRMLKQPKHCVAQDLERVQAALYRFDTPIFVAGGAPGQRWWWWRGVRPMGALSDSLGAAPDTSVSDFGMLRDGGRARLVLGALVAAPRVNIPSDVPTFQSTKVIELVAVKSMTAARTTVTLRLVAEGRAFFGETVRVVLEAS